MKPGDLHSLAVQPGKHMCFFTPCSIMCGGCNLLCCRPALTQEMSLKQQCYPRNTGTHVYAMRPTNVDASSPAGDGAEAAGRCDRQREHATLYDLKETLQILLVMLIKQVSRMFVMPHQAGELGAF